MKRNSVAAAVAASLASSIAIVSPASSQSSQSLPPVKISATNKVPECATPGRLMAMIGERNKSLDPRYANIATSYMRHGEEIGVRWDYAFFQMILETGSLAYKRGNGKPGDVKPSQNNFAGLGATGGGEPGEKFASIDEGVKAHLQHLQMYTGEQVANPVAERTRNVQQWGVLTSWQKGFKRPITFADVAGKWAPGSRGYVGDMKSIASDFYDDFCNKADPRPDMVREARVGAGAVTATRTARAAKPETAKPEVVDFARQANERARAEGDGARSSLGARGVVPPRTADVSAGANVPDGAPGFKVLNEQADAAPAPAPEKPADKPSDRPVQFAAAAATAAPAAKAPPATKNAAAAIPAAVGNPKPPATPPAATKCRVFTASYGGQKAVIIRANADSFTNFTVLDVNDGQETREVEAYISTYAKGGQNVGAFSSSNAALEEAFKLCPEG